jgi:hypothetical protein
VVWLYPLTSAVARNDYEGVLGEYERRLEYSLSAVLHILCDWLASAASLHLNLPAFPSCLCHRRKLTRTPVAALTCPDPS